MFRPIHFRSEYFELYGKIHQSLLLPPPPSGKQVYVKPGNGKYHCTVDLLFDWFEISCMTTDNFLMVNGVKLFTSAIYEFSC